jgi:hypothetical protein
VVIAIAVIAIVVMMIVILRDVILSAGEAGARDRTIL